MKNRLSRLFRFLSILVIIDLPLLFSPATLHNIKAETHPFSNPAGCFSNPPDSIEIMLSQAQSLLGEDFKWETSRNYYVWNTYQNSMVNVTKDPYVYEFNIDQAASPAVYEADRLVTIFQVSGFVVHLRYYGNHMRLLAIPMIQGVEHSAWADYVSAYWASGDSLSDDQRIIPTRKKLPCHWVIDEGYVSDDQLADLVNLDWHVPDFKQASLPYERSTCKETYALAATITTYQGKYVTSDGSMMCGPLTWSILNDANSFPYRIGNWTQNPAIFFGANPKWNGRPWIVFPPDTYDLRQVKEAMNGYDFEKLGNLFPGDVLYSYSTLYHKENSENFDHIFLVSAIDSNGARLSTTNLVMNKPIHDCTVDEVILYQPGDLENGFINHEWDGNGYGKTGFSGFDVFRWKWITYHLEGKARDYQVRYGDTWETIAFDWKIDPQTLTAYNHQVDGSQLSYQQEIKLPPVDK